MEIAQEGSVIIGATPSSFEIIIFSFHSDNLLMGNNYLGGPVREALLLGVDNLMEWSARLGKPVLVTSTVGVPGVGEDNMVGRLCRCIKKYVDLKSHTNGFLLLVNSILFLIVSSITFFQFRISKH